MSNRVCKMEGEELHTLGQHKAFEIVAVREEFQAELRLHSTGGRALVRRNFLEPMWDDLQREKKLNLAEWRVNSHAAWQGLGDKERGADTRRTGGGQGCGRR